MISPIGLLSIVQVFDLVHRGADQVRHDIVNRLVRLKSRVQYRRVRNRMACARSTRRRALHVVLPCAWPERKAKKVAWTVAMRKLLTIVDALIRRDELSTDEPKKAGI